MPVADTALALVRELCLAYPDTEEKIAWGESTFRVKGRLFVMFANDHHGDGRIAAWCVAPEGAQRDLVAAEPKHFFVPPYVGKDGWVGMRLDTKLSKKGVAAIIHQAYETALERVAAKKKRRR